MRAHAGRSRIEAVTACGEQVERMASEAANSQEGAMTFPHTTSSRNPLSILDLMVLVAVSALPLAGIRPPSDAAGFAAVMLPVGFLLWWLPGLGGQGRWTDLLILPVFMAMTLFYLFLSMAAFLCDPGAAVSVIGAQLIALIYVSFRS
jgi:hypothetical protein